MSLETQLKEKVAVDLEELEELRAFKATVLTALNLLDDKPHQAWYRFLKIARQEGLDPEPAWLMCRVSMTPRRILEAALRSRKPNFYESVFEQVADKLLEFLGRTGEPLQDEEREELLLKVRTTAANGGYGPDPTLLFNEIRWEATRVLEGIDDRDFDTDEPF